MKERCALPHRRGRSCSSRRRPQGQGIIRSSGTIGKTDAKALARYGKDRWPELARWQARDHYRLRLHALVTKVRRDGWLTLRRVAHGPPERNYDPV